MDTAVGVPFMNTTGIAYSQRKQSRLEPLT